MPWLHFGDCLEQINFEMVRLLAVHVCAFRSAPRLSASGVHEPHLTASGVQEPHLTASGVQEPHLTRLASLSAQTKHSVPI
jgi:hypothetical protein